MSVICIMQSSCICSTYTYAILSVWLKRVRKVLKFVTDYCLRPRSTCYQILILLPIKKKERNSVDGGN